MSRWASLLPLVRSFVSCCALALCLAAPASAALADERSPLALPLPASLTAVRDALVGWIRWGEDHPAEVLARLDAASPPEHVSAAQWAALRLSTQGLVAARSGLAEEVAAAVAGLRQLQRSHDSGLLAGDIALIQAQAADLRGGAEEAATLAAQADRHYEQGCANLKLPDGCDPRHRWLALHILTMRAMSQGNLVEAYALAERGLANAETAADLMLQSATAGHMALISRELGDADRALRQLRQADSLAHQSGRPAVLASLAIVQGMWAQGKGDALAAQRALQEALGQATRDGSPRLMAQAWINLSDGWARGDRPAQALAVLDQALPVLQRHHDLRAMASLLHNRGLAHLGLGQLAQGRTDLEEALALWQTQGAKAMMETALREHSDALAKRGDTSAALALYHREQALREDIQVTNRQAVMAQLRDRYRSEAEQRELALLTRENKLRSSQLRTQTLVRQVWLLAAVLMLLLAAAVYVLLRRARDANRQLRRSEALLKVQNERDPLTGLANRRHLRDVMMTRANAQAPFDGALLLLDIDHFKRINDGHGHGAGDLVLVEIARRLGEAVRDSDLACRWGGEEFLIFAPDLHGVALDSLAQRILHIVGDQAVSLPSGLSLGVTASLGYASFPLPPHQVSPHWEQAVNLVDLALYTAKSGGRDRAVRLTAAQADSVAGLAALEHEFQQAHRDGRINLVDHPRLSG
jgi:diguanylate cyclase (GGDEF)-like protein